MLRAPRHLLAISGFLALAAFAPHALAAGNIDSASKYAWGNTAGWVNFAPSNASVTVTASAITGYAWSANNGWLNLSPAQGGVTNDGTGTLGGFAWDSSAGWVSYVGVTIDSSGVFHGTATGADGYKINFDCANCKVSTSWRRAGASASHSGGSLIPMSGSEATTSVPDSNLTQTGPGSVAATAGPVFGNPRSSAAGHAASGSQDEKVSSTTTVQTPPPAPVTESTVSAPTTSTSSPHSAVRAFVLSAAIGLLLVLLIIAWRVLF